MQMGVFPLLIISAPTVAVCLIPLVCPARVNVATRCQYPSTLYHDTNAKVAAMLRAVPEHRDDDENDENSLQEMDSVEMLRLRQNSPSSRRSLLSKIGAGISALSSGMTPLSGVATVPGLPITAGKEEISVPQLTKGLNWPLGKVAFSLLPLAGTFTRRVTIQETIIPNLMWTHDQIQGVVNVNVPVRQTVIKLSPEAGGGLLVHNPVAPTPQLLDMVRALERRHGAIRHIVLGTVALEHKATFGPFALNFPSATVWVQQGQWSFPLDVPVEFLGVIQRGPRLRELPSSVTRSVSRRFQFYDERDGPPEWAADIEYESLGPLYFKSVGAYSETAFFHKSSKTLLVTDCVVQVTDVPPPIIEEDPRAMLFHARDNIKEVVVDTPETRKRGWRRMVQFGLVFFPSQIEVVPFTRAFQEAQRIDPSMKPLGQGAVPLSLYPWVWKDNDADQKNFDAISKQGALFCPPILTKLILDREPERTLDFVDRVATRFDFTRIIPCHLNNNVRAGPTDFREAFDVLTSDPKAGRLISQRPLAEDLALLQKASDLLTDLGVVEVSRVCDLEPARVRGRFASKG